MKTLLRAAGLLVAGLAAMRAAEFSPLVKLPDPAPEKKAELPDLREIDRPRNAIIRLPNYVVREEKVPKAPVFKDRDLLTPLGKLKLAYRDHPGLHLGNLPWIFSNDGIALFMREEEERLERKREFYDLVSLFPGKAEAKQAKDLADQAFARTNFGSSR